MPNHIHGILTLSNDANTNVNDNTSSNVATLLPNIPPLPPSEPITPKNEHMANKLPKANSVSVLIRSYKSALTKHANRLNIPFKWQARFHDHIIRTDKAYEQISDYINNNPLNWGKDKFYVKK